MSELLIDITVHINRPVNEVYDAWTSSDALASWFAPMATQKPEVAMEFVVGGRYSIEMPLPDGSVHTTTGVFREIVQNVAIVMTWHCDAFQDPESQVDVRFFESDGGTDIHLKHMTFDLAETCDAHRGGWEACLSELDKYLTTTSGV